MKFAVDLTSHLGKHGFSKVENSYVERGDLSTTTDAEFCDHKVKINLKIKFEKNDKIKEVLALPHQVFFSGEGWQEFNSNFEDAINRTMKFLIGKELMHGKKHY